MTEASRSNDVTVGPQPLDASKAIGKSDEVQAEEMAIMFSFGAMP
jgi:hypothetical protein